MHIGEVATRSGIPAPTIRFYETEKLITRPVRSPSGYRVYSERILDELLFIRRAQRLSSAICQSHIVEIDRHVAELQEFRQRLEDAHRFATQECGFTSEGFCRAIFSVQDADVPDM